MNVFKSTTDMWYWVLQPSVCILDDIPPRHLNWYDLKYIGSLSSGRSLISCILWIGNHMSLIWEITTQLVVLARGGLSPTKIQKCFDKWQNNKVTITVMYMKSGDNSKTGLWFVRTGMLRNKLFLYHPSISGLLGLFQPGEKLWWKVGQLRKQTS